MFSGSIQTKLTFFILVLLIPTLVLLYAGERIIGNQIGKTQLGVSGLSIIKHLWNKTEVINGVAAGSNVNESDLLVSFFQKAEIGKKQQVTMSKQWEMVHSDEVSNYNKLVSARRLISKVAQASNLTAVLSDASPELAIVISDRIPELSYKVEKLVRLAERLKKKPVLSHTDIMAFLVNAGQFKGVADYTSRISREAVTFVNAEDKDVLNKLAKAYRKQNAKFQGAAVKTTKSAQVFRSGPQVKLDKFLDAETKFDKAISNYWQASEAAFSKWLYLEEARLVRLSNTVISSILAFLAILIVATLLLRRSIVRQTIELEVSTAQTEKQNLDLLEREQELILQRKNAQKGEKSKSEFLANMSHEIRTPMNGVMGMAELLAATQLNPKQKMFTDVIVKSGAALLTIINDILDFSKIDAGQMQLTQAPFEIGEAIEDVATLVSSKAAEKDLELIVRIDPKLPNMLFGDVGRLRQIVTNLLGNAIKFTEQGQVFVNVTGDVSTVNEGEQLKLRVSIEDTGMGIPQEDCASIFQKFTQVDGSATRKHEGTGLGLSIASSLVAMMEGEMGVESKVGEGSTFWFTAQLPVHEGEKREKILPNDLGGARVLIVDDNKVNRSILSEQMSAWNFDYAAACSGQEGLDVIRATVASNIQLDLVILDYQMPGMSGLELLEIVRNDEALCGIPVVVLSSVDSSEITNQLIQLGVSANLTKPTRSSLLLETIVQVIAENRERSTDAVPSDFIRADNKPETLSSDDFTQAKSHTIDERAIKTAKSSQLDIMIAEDNEVNQIVFSQIIEATEYNYEVYDNGRLAIEAYVQNQPRLILMDISMPEMNGKQATMAIRQFELENNLPAVPIICVTAHALKGDMEEIMAVGVDDYLSKPVSPQVLTAKLDHWLTRTNARKAASGER